MTSRRGFIAQLAALVAAGAAAPAIVARLRPSSRATNEFVGYWDDAASSTKNVLDATFAPRRWTVERHDGSVAASGPMVSLGGGRYELKDVPPLPVGAYRFRWQGV